jgi:hypothetical protein
MADFNVRSDAVNVEQIMEQIRARIVEKRGVDYTDDQIRELAAVKLQKFLDPRGVRSDLLEEFRKQQPPYEPPQLPNYAFEEHTLYESHRGPLRLIRQLLNPLLKMLFNPNPLIQALNIQSKLNTIVAEREARYEASKRATDALYYELIHNLVVETTRLGIEVKNLTMKVESLTGRLEFNERRARALESAVVYRPAPGDIVVVNAGEGTNVQRSNVQRSNVQGSQVQGSQVQGSNVQGSSVQGSNVQGSGGQSGGGQPGEGPGQRSRRRRRRRGRRGGGSAAAIMGGGAGQAGAAGVAQAGPADAVAEHAEGAEHGDHGGDAHDDHGHDDHHDDGGDPGDSSAEE